MPKTSMSNATDVIVVGAGVAGAAAALEAGACGASFLGIDQAQSFGGTARHGGVGCSVAGSPLQKQHGIADSPAKAVADLMAGRNDADPVWARLYYRRAVAEVYGWYVGLGAEFDGLIHMEGDRVPRWHRPKGGGAQVMARAWARFGELGQQQCWRFGLSVVDLLREGDSFVGVRVRDRSGNCTDLRGGAVVLATGGFAGNLDMARATNVRLARIPRLLAGGNPSAQGALHEIVSAHGGELTHMRDIYAYANGTPDYRDAAGRRGVVVRWVKDWIWVNQAGRRFHDEDLHVTGRTATPHLLRQSPPTCWAILDEPMLSEVNIFDHYVEPNSEGRADVLRRFIANSPYVWKAPTARALAERAGIEIEPFLETVRKWNDKLASGAALDARTGRKLAGLRPLGRGPWYAIQFFPLVRKTMGGVRTDLRCRVFDKSGAVMPGLFAAGELSGMAGGRLAGARPLEGIMAGGSVFSGRIAGRWAARPFAQRTVSSRDSKRRG